MARVKARLDSRSFARRCAQIAEEKKGGSIQIRDVRKLVSITDYFVLVTVGSRRQAQAIAHEIQKEMKSLGYVGRIEGERLGWWVLIDFDVVVVHVLQKEAREYYRLEHLWDDAPTIPSAGRGSRGKKAQAS